MRPVLLTALAVALLLTTLSVRAQDDAVPAAAGEMDEEPVYTPEQKEQAKEHFLRGIKLLDEQAWGPALAEFLASREAFPTRVATNNAAIALRRLQRYDEALDMFETLLRDFNVPDAEREAAQRQLSELRELVGTIDIRGAEPGASIVVSSADRGEYPPIKPLRVPAGNHVVRVFKAGFEPFETRVDVAGGQVAFVDVKMAKLRDSGTLRVLEGSGRQANVFVDNVMVGVTPWSGTLGVGEHVVSLQGEGSLGSQPARTVVRSQATTDLTLVIEELDSSLRVNPTPPGASVWIDSVNVGNGVWQGPLRAGKHKVEVKADGFLSETRITTLTRGEPFTLDVALERDEDAPMWRKPSRWNVDGQASLLIVPSFGGPVADSCGDGCRRAPGLGAMAQVEGAYELGSGLGFGVALGGLIAGQSIEGREAVLLPHGFSDASGGRADDSLRLAGFMAGATIGYRHGETWPLRLRTGVGVLYGEMRDERRGRFEAHGGGGFDAYPVAAFPKGTFVYVDPGASIGYSFGSFELSAGVKALMLVGVAPPRWSREVEVGAGTDGLGSYPEDDLTGPFVVGIAPGLTLRYVITNDR